MPMRSNSGPILHLIGDPVGSETLLTHREYSLIFTSISYISCIYGAFSLTAYSSLLYIQDLAQYLGPLSSLFISFSFSILVEHVV